MHSYKNSYYSGLKIGDKYMKEFNIDTYQMATLLLVNAAVKEIN